MPNRTNLKKTLATHDKYNATRKVVRDGELALEDLCEAIEEHPELLAADPLKKDAESLADWLEEMAQRLRGAISE